VETHKFLEIVVPVQKTIAESTQLCVPNGGTPTRESSRGTEFLQTLTCDVARTQYPTGTRTALIPALAITEKSSSVIHEFRWSTIAARSVSVSPCFAAACACQRS